MLKSIKNKKGFTVIELLIATAVFSVVLLVFVAAFLRVSELFYKGINLSNTQETARNAVQNIANDIQFYGNPPSNFPAQSYFCIGNHRYTYKLGTPYSPGSSTDIGLMKETVSACSAGAPNIATAEELLDPGMQLNSIQLNNCQFGQCTVSLHIVFYGTDPTVLTPNAQDPNAQCSGPPNSTQYCATADYSATVLQTF